MKRAKNEILRRVCVTECVTGGKKQEGLSAVEFAKPFRMNNAPGTTRTCDLLVRSLTAIIILPSPHISDNLKSPANAAYPPFWIILDASQIVT